MYKVTFEDFARNIESEDINIRIVRDLPSNGCTIYGLVLIKEESEVTMLLTLFHELEHIVIPEVTKSKIDQILLGAAIDILDTKSVYKQYKNIDLDKALTVYEIYKDDLKQKVISKIRNEVLKDVARDILNIHQRDRDNVCITRNTIKCSRCKKKIKVTIHDKGDDTYWNGDGDIVAYKTDHEVLCTSCYIKEKEVI